MVTDKIHTFEGDLNSVWAFFYLEREYEGASGYQFNGSEPPLGWDDPDHVLALSSTPVLLSGMEKFRSFLGRSRELGYFELSEGKLFIPWRVVYKIELKVEPRPVKFNYCLAPAFEERK